MVGPTCPSRFDRPGRRAAGLTTLGRVNSPVDPKDLRVSDAERTHVLGLLEKATGQGMIDLGEYAARSTAVINARTRGDLNAVLVDLPGLQLAGRTVEQAGRDATTSPPPGPGWSGAPSTARGGTEDVLEIIGFGSRVFRGTWVVPPRIVIGGAGSATKLDFTEARLTSRTVTVEFRNNFAGAADLIVPAGTGVRLDGLDMRGGQLNNKVLPGRTAPTFELILVGIKRFGSVTIRTPRQGLFGR